MRRHRRVPEKDGKTELDAAGLAQLAQEPEGGRHAAVDEADPDETEE